MRAQFQSMGLSLDWSREIATCDPAYYRHEQAMFLDFLDAGLVYRKESWVNWDPVDQTVLANEQVIEGRGWRSGAVVERRKLAQWFFKITEYTEELLDALSTLDRWPPKVRLMQERWIGRSEARASGFRSSAARTRSRCSPPARHPVRRELHGAGARSSARRRAGRRGSRRRRVRAECARTATSEEAIEQAEKVGHDTGLRCRNRSSRSRSCRSTSPISC